MLADAIAASPGAVVQAISGKCVTTPHARRDALIDRDDGTKKRFLEPWPPRTAVTNARQAQDARAILADERHLRLRIRCRRALRSVFRHSTAKSSCSAATRPRIRKGVGAFFPPGEIPRPLIRVASPWSAIRRPSAPRLRLQARHWIHRISSPRSRTRARLVGENPGAYLKAPRREKSLTARGARSSARNEETGHNSPYPRLPDAGSRPVLPRWNHMMTASRFLILVPRAEFVLSPANCADIRPVPCKTVACCRSLI